MKEMSLGKMYQHCKTLILDNFIHNCQETKFVLINATNQTNMTVKLNKHLKRKKKGTSQTGDSVLLAKHAKNRMDEITAARMYWQTRWFVYYQHIVIILNELYWMIQNWMLMSMTNMNYCIVIPDYIVRISDTVSINPNSSQFKSRRLQIIGTLLSFYIYDTLLFDNVMWHHLKQSRPSNTSMSNS